MPLAIKTETSSLFTTEMRREFGQMFAPGNPERVLSVGDCFEVHLDEDRIESMERPHAWRLKDENIIAADHLFGASLPVLKRCSASFFLAFGNVDLTEALSKHLLEMAEQKQGVPAYDVLCMSFGLLLISGNPAIDMCIDANEQKKERIDQAVADANIRVVFDAGISAHERIEAIPRIETFIADMVSQTLDARADSARWNSQKWKPFYDGVEFRIDAAKAA